VPMMTAAGSLQCPGGRSRYRRHGAGKVPYRTAANLRNFQEEVKRTAIKCPAVVASLPSQFLKSSPQPGTCDILYVVIIVGLLLPCPTLLPRPCRFAFIMVLQISIVSIHKSLNRRKWC
jgi:hypothetical protein